MAIWLVRATWREDETEATEEWMVEAATVQEAVTNVTAHLRFPPHHLEARIEQTKRVFPDGLTTVRHVSQPN